MNYVYQKVRNMFWREAIHTTTTTNCNTWEEHLVRDGGYVYFSDIDYSCQSVAIWDTLNHLRRMQYKLLAVGEGALDDEALMDEMRGALDWWLDHDFTNPNWWFNQIGMVSNMCAIVIMLGDRLSKQQISRAAELISRGSVAGTPSIMRWTGANLIWGIRDTIYHALIIGDEALMETACARIADEIRIAPRLDEGIKPDMSFYQHGQILYSCGYGRSFTLDTAMLISVLAGSKFALAEDKAALFESFLLDGQQYMMRHGAVDYQTVGREISRPGALSSAAFASAVSYLLESDCCQRKEELRVYHAALTGKRDTFSGTKYFPCSYFLVHKTPDFHIAVKGCHTEYKGTEWGLAENRLGCNLNNGGVMTMMASGREYENFNPLTDYAKIPGTTAPAWDDACLWEHSVGDWKSPAGTNDDCGGWAEDGWGVLFMRLEHDGISGYKAYFAYPDGMVCLGCALDGPETLYTTVDQAFRDGELFEARPVAKGERVVNGGFGYTNLGEAPMTASAANVTGAWSRNSPAQSSDPVEGQVFLMTVDHSEIKEYAYAVTTPTADMAKITSIVNTPSEQSVTFADGKVLSVLRDDSGAHIAVCGKAVEMVQRY